MNSKALSLLAVSVVWLAALPAAASDEAVGVSSITDHTLRLAEGAAPPAARVDQISWLAGIWLGEGMGGAAEEAWTPPSGGSMVGVFKLLSPGDGEPSPRFYEMLAVLETGDTLELRLKHFDPDVTGWEEKDDFVSFPLVKIEPDAVYFRGLTYEKKGDDGLVVYLAMKTKDGTREVEFTFSRRE